MRRVINGLLLLGIAAGGTMAWRTDRQRARLQTEFQRLARIIVGLTVDDKSKIYIQALETGDPRHFAWKVYLPPVPGLELRTSGMIAGFGSDTNPSGEFLVRVGFHKYKQGRWGVYTQYGSSTDWRTFGDKELADLLHNHWDEIHIEQAGAPVPLMVDPKAPTVLLRLMLPDDLRAAVRARVRPDSKDEPGQPLLELQFGPEEALGPRSTPIF
jgi:hypothetical protein